MRRRELLAAAFALPARAQRRRPNIVLLLADDLGYGELGCQGNAEIPTPHIDSIARGGVRFTQGYATAPYCTPSRAELLTGRYQTRFGHELNVVGAQNLDQNVGLPLSETTLAERLQKAGYATGCIGKWHLGANEKFHPQPRGFDEFYGFLHEGHFYQPPPYDGLNRGCARRSRLTTPGTPSYAAGRRWWSLSTSPMRWLARPNGSSGRIARSPSSSICRGTRRTVRCKPRTRHSSASRTLPASTGGCLPACFRPWMTAWAASWAP